MMVALSTVTLSLCPTYLLAVLFSWSNKGRTFLNLSSATSFNWSVKQVFLTISSKTLLGMAFLTAKFLVSSLCSQYILRVLGVM